MLRFLGIFATGILLSLSFLSGASAQQANNYWFNGTPGTSCPSCWTPASPTTPVPTASAPSGASYTWLNDIKATTSIATALSLSSLINAAATYCVIQAISGTAYGTYDGSTPSSSNYDITISALQAYPVTGTSSLGKLQIQGTNLAGNCWK